MLLKNVMMIWINIDDVFDISRGTTKQDELFDYVEEWDYLKERVRDFEDYEYEENFKIIGWVYSLNVLSAPRTSNVIYCVVLDRIGKWFEPRAFCT